MESIGNSSHSVPKRLQLNYKSLDLSAGYTAVYRRIYVNLSVIPIIDSTSVDVIAGVRNLIGLEIRVHRSF